MIEISRQIIENHSLYYRDFPWRHTKDPYKIMVAELMLRRTKAEQVVPVYTKFLIEYPDLKSLALADIEDISIVTIHLGLHWRAADFINACRFIETEYNRTFPDNRTNLLKIPGIGEYIAGAILTICFKKPEYVVDSNISRFINRFYDLNLKGEIRRKKLIIEKAKEFFNCKSPDKLLFSILDFTAIICKPRIPLCPMCYFRDSCQYRNKTK